DADRIYPAEQLPRIVVRPGPGSLGHAVRALPRGVRHSGEFHFRKLRIDPGMVLSEISHADHADPNRGSGRRPVGCGLRIGHGSPPTTLTPDSSACFSIRSLSNRIVFPTSSASTEARAAFIESMVCGPTAGTSKRRSWLGLLTLMTTAPSPPKRP